MKSFSTNRNHKKARKAFEQLEKSIQDSTERFLSDSKSELESKSKEEFVSTFFDWINNELLEKDPIYFIVDHRSKVLSQARVFLKKNEYELSTIMYATFFEHSINRIIRFKCVIENIDLKIQKEIIRSTNTKAKYTWILKLLGLPNFYNKHLKSILSLTENRNSFIHYKWNSEKLKLPKANAKGIIKKTQPNIFSDIEKAITYLKNYERRIEEEYKTD